MTIRIARLVVGGAPWWQPWLAAALMTVTAALTLRMIAGLFRVRTQLAGQPLNAERDFRALIGSD